MSRKLVLRSLTLTKHTCFLELYGGLHLREYCCVSNLINQFDSKSYLKCWVQTDRRTLKIKEELLSGKKNLYKVLCLASPGKKDLKHISLSYSIQ